LSEWVARVLSIFTGNASYNDIPIMHRAKLNIVQCQRSSTYIAKIDPGKVRCPLHQCIPVLEWSRPPQALRDVGKFFHFEENAEKVIAQELAKYQPMIDHY